MSKLKDVVREYHIQPSSVVSTSRTSNYPSTQFEAPRSGSILPDQNFWNSWKSTVELALYQESAGPRTHISAFPEDLFDLWTIHCRLRPCFGKPLEHHASESADSPHLRPNRGDYRSDGGADEEHVAAGGADDKGHRRARPSQRQRETAARDCRMADQEARSMNLHAGSEMQACTRASACQTDSQHREVSCCLDETRRHLTKACQRARACACALNRPPVRPPARLPSACLPAYPPSTCPSFVICLARVSVQ